MNKHTDHAHDDEGHQHHDHDAHNHGKQVAASHKHHDHDHDHNHDHGHDHHGHGHHGHHHHFDPAGNRRAFALAIGMNAAFVAIEFTYGLIANSTALMADAGHNLSDVLGLILAWGAAMLTRSAPSQRYTYGLRSSSILAALLNALLLMLACGAIAWEAVHRLSDPAPVSGLMVSVVAGIGILVNGASAWLFMAGSKHDLNMKAAYQHLAADAAISLGVLVSGLIYLGTGWNWLDPVVSIVIVALILMGTWGLLRESFNLVLAAVPANVDPEQVKRHLVGLPGVREIHDLHIWAMSTTETALTAHLVMPQGYPGDQALDEIVAGIKGKFAIHHCTLQVEQGTTTHDCSLHGAHEL